MYSVENWVGIIGHSRGKSVGKCPGWTGGCCEECQAQKRHQRLSPTTRCCRISRPAQNPNPPNQPGPQQPAPQQPEPERKPKYKFYVGPDIGVYMPASSKTRDRFSSDWLSYGVGISSISTPRSSGRFSPDIQILSQSNGDDSLFFGLIGVEYQQALIPGQGQKAAKQQPGQPKPEPPHNRDYIPYFGLSAYEAVGDLVAVEDGGYIRGFRLRSCRCCVPRNRVQEPRIYPVQVFEDLGTKRL